MAIRYIRGETKPIRFSFKSLGAAQAITGHTRARMAVASSPTGTVLISADTSTDDASRITANDDPGYVELYPTLDESLSLPAGSDVFVGVFVLIGGKWIAPPVQRMTIVESVGEPEASP